MARLCIGRLGSLAKGGRLIPATNAAGLLAEASESFRAAVAGPFFRVASRLDADGRLGVVAADCQGAPLVEGVSEKRLEHVIRLAEVRLGERLNLNDVADAVFVTGARDFGPGTPLGDLTARWLEQVRQALPARYAAIQALLLPPPRPQPQPQPSAQPEPRPQATGLSGESDSAGAADPAPTAAPEGGLEAPEAPRGGYIRIQVEDDDEESPVDEPFGSPRAERGSP